MHGIYAYTHACLRAYTHTYTNAYMHTCVHTCAHTQCGGKKSSAHTHRHDIDTIIQRAENSPPRPPYPLLSLSIPHVPIARVPPPPSFTKTNYYVGCSACNL